MGTKIVRTHQPDLPHLWNTETRLTMVMMMNSGKISAESSHHPDLPPQLKNKMTFRIGMNAIQAFGVPVFCAILNQIMAPKKYEMMLMSARTPCEIPRSSVD